MLALHSRDTAMPQRVLEESAVLRHCQGLTYLVQDVQLTQVKELLNRRHLTFSFF